MGSSNENSAFGPVLNPWDRARVPGGSSGGSAAAVAAGLAPWAIGTDTGGSIRQPAALCGIVGLKPTYGACSRYGMIAFASSLDQAGPLTRDVTDAALLLRAHGRPRSPRLDLARVPRGDRAAAGGGSERHPARRARGADRGRRRESSAGVRQSFDATLDARRGPRAPTVEPCRLPHAPHALSAYYLIAPAEASANLARFDGVRYGLRVDGDADLITMYSRTRDVGFGAEVKRRIMLGTYALSSGYYDAYYGTAQKVRTKIAEDFATAFERFDFIVTPTSPWTAFELGSKTDDPLAMYLNDFCTVPMSLAGIPAISIPSGLSDGLPVGFQLAGPAFSESRLLDAAYALERAIGFDGSAARPMTRGCAEIRAGDRPRDPRPAEHADEDVLRLRAVVQRPAEHPHLPDLPRPARRAARGQRARDPLRDHDRARARVRDRRAVAVPPQELLLSRPPQGLPDLPVRRAAVPRRPARRRPHPPRPPRGGRRQARTTSGRAAGSTARIAAGSTSTAAARRWSRS